MARNQSADTIGVLVWDSYTIIFTLTVFQLLLNIILSSPKKVAGGRAGCLRYYLAGVS